MTEFRTLRAGVFLPPFHPNDEDPLLCMERDFQLMQWLELHDYAEAWIETPSTSAAVLSGVVVYFTPQGGSETPYQGSQVTAGTTWTQSQLQFTVTTAGTAYIQVHVFNPPSPGTCIVVDDVSLQLQ